MAPSLEGTKILKISALQTLNFDDFGCSTSISRSLGAARHSRAILRKLIKTILKKLDLAERIRMHRSRASVASNLSRYGQLKVMHLA